MNQATSKTIFWYQKASWLERTTRTCILCSDGRMTRGRYLKNVLEELVSALNLALCGLVWTLGNQYIVGSLSWRSLNSQQTYNPDHVVSGLIGFLFLWVLEMGYIIVLWHFLSLPYNYFSQFHLYVFLYKKNIAPHAC